jgi:CTD small phosphatase-like protein 2
MKDLSRVGRPLERTIIIDNLKENFMWQKDNGIQIKSWYSDQ